MVLYICQLTNQPNKLKYLHPKYYYLICNKREMFYYKSGNNIAADG